MKFQRWLQLKGQGTCVHQPADICTSIAIDMRAYRIKPYIYIVFIRTKRVGVKPRLPVTGRARQSDRLLVCCLISRANARIHSSHAEAFGLAIISEQIFAIIKLKASAFISRNMPHEHAAQPQGLPGHVHQPACVSPLVMRSGTLIGRR